MVYGNQNLTEFFDTVLEMHCDHEDTKGTPKWAAITANGSKQAYFKSKRTESMIFNDGDGSLLIVNEANFHTPGAQFATINAGLQTHHGAIAVTLGGVPVVKHAVSAKPVRQTVRGSETNESH